LIGFARAVVNSSAMPASRISALAETPGARSEDTFSFECVTLRLAVLHEALRGFPRIEYLNHTVGCLFPPPHSSKIAFDVNADIAIMESGNFVINHPHTLAVDFDPIIQIRTVRRAVVKNKLFSSTRSHSARVLQPHRGSEENDVKA
jgi:hypothetical protein